MNFVEQHAELEALLDRASYLLTSARSAGLADTEKLRESLKGIRSVIQDADALVASVEAASREDA